MNMFFKEDEDIFEPENWKQRLKTILFMVLMSILTIVFIVFILLYIFLGLFILDWIYWVFSGKTIVWGKLDNPI